MKTALPGPTSTTFPPITIDAVPETGRQPIERECGANRERECSQIDPQHQASGDHGTKEQPPDQCLGGRPKTKIEHEEVRAHRIGEESARWGRTLDQPDQRHQEYA